MGKVTGRVLGNVSGKVGSTNFSRWKKIYTAKSLPTVRPKKKGSAISPQNLKFKLMGNLLAYIKPAINLGYYNKTNKCTPFSLAMKHNLANAIKGEYPDLEIDFPKIKISHGNREGAWSARILFEPDCRIKFTWQISELADLKVIGKDKAYIIFHDSTVNRSFSIACLTTRNTLVYTVNHSKEYAGNTIHAWIFFLSADGNITSNSDYMGSGVLIA